jgi:hypothetical protein
MRSILIALVVFASSSAGPRQGTEFSRLVARLSEPGGYFDSDNLVSNETSYLHVVPALRTLKVRGGAYIGVGPEQNFSYIAEIKPRLAILVDIRRDNMLLHLLFKAMFETAQNRMEYLCLLYGRPAPLSPSRWTDRSLEEILTYVDITPGDSALHDRTHRALMERVVGYGVPLSDTDRVTLRRFHDEFVSAGLGIRFTSRGRPPRPGYPTERDLYLSTDLEGHQASYLASEGRFRVVRDMERRDRIIPAVGDLSGAIAMRAIAGFLRESALLVSAFYTSNVEMYLFRQGSFPRYAENVRALPSDPSSVIIRSAFGGGWRGGEPVPMPQPAPGHLSVQLLQAFPVFLQLTARSDSISYWQILQGAAVEARPPALRPRERRNRRRRRRGALASAATFPSLDSSR